MIATDAAVEAHLAGLGVALTMGGEPTFVPERPKGAEWSIAALGPTKLHVARAMTAAFIGDRYAGALIMQVFGKQFPGEPLPRWNLLTYWRKDGQPIWRDRSMLYVSGEPINTHQDAALLAKQLAQSVDLQRYLLPAFNQIDDKVPAAWVLPIDAADADDASERAWRSSRWPFDAGNPMVLIPGDSQAGLKLPLAEVPDKMVRRAATVEMRGGLLEVFIPPLLLEDFLRLISTVESAAKAVGVRDIVLCGYPPEGTQGRLASVGLTSDPGVLEVNLPVCADWGEYADYTEQIFKAAQAAGLTTRKFRLNGQEQGTGGGAHLAFGGPEPERSPFFARPRLLANIIRYWQRHPALSYFFTGQFVGSSSQAPRVDETTMDALYELDIACRGAEAWGSDMDPVFLDRLFRDLLIDGGGNTHRAEICIDKLWNPFAPNGKTGIIEFRAFETFPDARAQSLVGLTIRAILAMLADREPIGSFTPHGDRLHDRFFLPAVIWQDFLGVLADLAEVGFAFDAAWFQPLFAFRFPVLGTLQNGPFELTVRQALESFPLLGEQPSGSTTIRLVDSTNDRLELVIHRNDGGALGSARDALGDIRVNGVRPYFEAVDESGNALISGIRYKAATAPTTLHPHISVQSPLGFVWQRNGEACGAKFHYWNPGEEEYPPEPIDASEAAKRRAERWLPIAGDELAFLASNQTKAVAEEHPGRICADLRR